MFTDIGVRIPPTKVRKSGPVFYTQRPGGLVALLGHSSDRNKFSFDILTSHVASSCGDSRNSIGNTLNDLRMTLST